MPLKFLFLANRRIKFERVYLRLKACPTGGKLYLHRGDYYGSALHTKQKIFSYVIVSRMLPNCRLKRTRYGALLLYGTHILKAHGKFRIYRSYFETGAHSFRHIFPNAGIDTQNLSMPTRTFPPEKQFVSSLSPNVHCA